MINFNRNTSKKVLKELVKEEILGRKLEQLIDANRQLINTIRAELLKLRRGSILQEHRGRQQQGNKAPDVETAKTF